MVWAQFSNTKGSLGSIIDGGRSSFGAVPPSMVGGGLFPAGKRGRAGLLRCSGLPSWGLAAARLPVPSKIRNNLQIVVSDRYSSGCASNRIQNLLASVLCCITIRIPELGQVNPSWEHLTGETMFKAEPIFAELPAEIQALLENYTLCNLDSGDAETAPYADVADRAELASNCPEAELVADLTVHFYGLPGGPVAPKWEFPFQVCNSDGIIFQAHTGQQIVDWLTERNAQVDAAQERWDKMDPEEQGEHLDNNF